MKIEGKCPFYRITDPSQLSFGTGIGFCDLGVVWAICEGDVRFCEEPERFVENFFCEWKKRKGKGRFLSLPLNVHPSPAP
ncbi:MAG: hypothetical protein N3G78_10310 [Desulfobacterota bacterium]|nr:hypothetical protein [Thermodesulfobacteriota bacterium]